MHQEKKEEKNIAETINWRIFSYKILLILFVLDFKQNTPDCFKHFLRYYL